MQCIRHWEWCKTIEKGGETDWNSLFSTSLYRMINQEAGVKIDFVRNFCGV